MILITKTIRFMRGKRTKKHVVREMTEEEEKALDEVFEQMDDAFASMGKAFDALRKL